MLRWLCVLLCVAACGGSVDFLLGRPRNGFVLLPPPETDILLQDGPNITTAWFTQKLDHFNPVDTRTFPQQYQTIDGYYKPGGPLFVMINGEGPMSPRFMAPGRDWVLNAQKYGAMMIQLEHRYYGETHPTPDLSLGNMKYLSSEQALADTAYFIQNMKIKFGMENAKTIVFGGSYAGNLANWFHLKYPHVADGAVGSSAPVWATVDFYQYMEVVGNSLDMISPGCSLQVSQAFSQLEVWVQQGLTNTINNTFKLCTPLNLGDSYSIQNMFATLAGPFQGAVQYNGQGPYAVLPLCQIMQNTTGGTQLQRLATLAQIHYGDCLPNSYQEDIDYLSQTSWDIMSGGSRQWMYQTCTEFGYYQSTDSKNQPFGSTVTVDFYLHVYCNLLFGITPNVVSNAVVQSNQIYGGLQLQTKWIVMPNGNVDPWHALSVLHDISPTAISVFMNGTSHCQDMSYHNAAIDSAALVNGRKRISQQIGLILSQ